MESEAKKGNKQIPPPRTILASAKDSHDFLTHDFFITALDILNNLSEQLISVPSQDFIQAIPQKACELLSAPICVLWKFDEEKQKFNVIASWGKVDNEYKESELNLDDEGVKYIFTKDKVLALANVNQSNPKLSDLEKLNKRGWISLLSAPLKNEKGIIGILNVHAKKPSDFVDWQKKFLERLAHYTTLSFQKEEISSDRNKLQALSNTMLEMTEASEPSRLWELLRQGALTLVRSEQVWMGKLDYDTGELKTVTPEQELGKNINILFGKGITGRALEAEKPIRVDDVLQSPWKEIYVPALANNRSELAIPILIEKIPIRDKNEVKLGSKVIGVLDIENPNTYAFSEIDEERLWLLARYAASRFEKLDLDRKLHKLRKVERELTNPNNKPKTYDEIIDIVIKGITEILGFEWVNISLIDKERTQIKSEYVVMKGWTKKQINHFKATAKHDLDSDDIQADIVKNRQIEVPEKNDKRFDAEIFNEFEHNNLVRVYIPMISPVSNQVIGTVEVGYNRKYRKYIYEEDVQVLKNFVDDAVHALERKKSGIIDKISHELKSPIIGIRNNASYIQRRIDQLTGDKIRIKCDDILLDCDSLLYQVRQIEHFMGKSVFQKPKIEKTFVFRDIVIKTINQLKPTIQRDYGFPVENLEYEPDSIKKIIIDTDKIKLSQVVYNLLLNSVRYAEEDPKKFRIRLDATEDKTIFIIRFKDWGMGIKEEDKDKIFQEGFRSLEAIAKNVSGSGLGLAISKAIMTLLGGDLILHRLSKPTEFHVILPKSKEFF